MLPAFYKDFGFNVSHFNYTKVHINGIVKVVLHSNTRTSKTVYRACLCTIPQCLQITPLHTHSCCSGDKAYHKKGSVLSFFKGHNATL